MPVGGVALADTLHISWINLMGLLVFSVCASDSLWYGFWGCFDYNVGLAERNMCPASRLCYSHTSTRSDT